MRKIFTFLFAALLSLSAWSYDNVPATFTWTVGNESEAMVASDASDGVKGTAFKAGSALTKGERSNLAANPNVPMVTFTPSTNKPGTVASAMVEYSVKMKKGVTFTLTGIDYDAIKQGTDGASYHWAYAVDGTECSLTEVTKTEILRDNKTAPPALHHTHTIENAAAGQTVSVRFYVSGFDASKLLCLSQIVMTGVINGEEEVRAFTDFKIEFRDNPYSVILPEGGVLPQGVEVDETNYNGSQHGVQGGYINVPVDGPVKFTIGACQYSSTNIAIKKNGEAFATISNNAPCGEQKPNYNQFVTWTYNVEEAATLTFEFGSQTYVPYFFAEACEFVPEVEVRYYDTDGRTLIGEPQIVAGGSALTFAYGISDVTVADGKAFRGWFTASDPTATKVAEGIDLTEDLSLYARATDIEVVELGAIFEYDLTKSYFYMEDHEAISANGGAFHDAKHGWAFSNGTTLSVQVAGNAVLIVGVCEESATSITEVKDAAGTKVGEISVKKKGAEDSTPDGSLQAIQYTGDATTLTLHFTATNYIHSIKVYNISDLPAKDEATGYYIIAPNDAAGFILTLEMAEAGDKIFLPNGVYDLGEKVMTPISKNNISIVGQSMEGVIIKNTPDFHNEGLGKVSTLCVPNNISGLYMQDLTIQNAMDYYAAIAAGLQGGRAACLEDEGNHTVLKNVRMLSYQDTYYGKKSGTQHYFEDCEIHGTVDYLCGGSTVYFKNNLLYCEKRKLDGSGQDVITANGSKDESGDKGYVFEGCTIKSECPVVSFGRAWSDQCRTVFLNTLVDYSAGQFSFNSSDGKIQRWTKTGINTNPTFYGEYNTHLADGTVLTPASNVVTFDKNGTVQMETVLSAEQAAVFTMEYTLGSWATTAQADATQAVCDLQNIDPAGVYLVETLNGNAILYSGAQLAQEIFPEDSGITIRKANARGGFGAPADEETEGCITVNAERAAMSGKIIRNGQLFIERDGKIYNVLGSEVK